MIPPLLSWKTWWWLKNGPGDRSVDRVQQGTGVRGARVQKSEVKGLDEEMNESKINSTRDTRVVSTQCPPSCGDNAQVVVSVDDSLRGGTPSIGQDHDCGRSGPLLNERERFVKKVREEKRNREEKNRQPGEEYGEKDVDLEQGVWNASKIQMP